MSYAMAYEREPPTAWAFAPNGGARRKGHENPVYLALDMLVSDERGKPQPLPTAAACRHNVIERKLYLSAFTKALSASKLTSNAPKSFILGEPRHSAYRLVNTPDPWLLFANHRQIADSFLVAVVIEAKSWIASWQPSSPVQSTIPVWVTDFYKESASRASRSSLKVLFTEVGSLLRHGETNALDRVLASIEMRRLPPELVMGIVRATYVARGRLPSWKAARTRAVSELKRRGLPADDIMVGLLADTDDDANTSSR
jgi:hypothetical protein